VSGADPLTLGATVTIDKYWSSDVFIKALMANALSLLRSFLAVYRAGSVTGAAPALNLTQPAVSGHIKALEAQLGRPLFVRLPRGIAATAAGHDLARSIAPHLDAVESVVESVRAGGRAPSGTLYIGGPAEFLATVVLPAIAPLAASGVRVRVTSGLPDDLIARLPAGDLDLVVATRQVRRRNIEFGPLFTEQFVLVGAPMWARQIPAQVIDAGGAGALEGVPLIAYSEEFPVIGRYWREVFDADVPEPQILVPDLRAVIAATVAGAGVTAAPRYLCDDDIARGRLVVMHQPARVPENTIFLAWKAGALVSPRIAAARDILVRALPPMGAVR
jgi:DNA-binding transcriptional LysR family regulator